MLRPYFNCNERLEIFLTCFCNILCYVGGDYLKVGGDHLKVDGDHLKVNGNYLKVDGDHLKVDRENLTVDGDHFRVDGDHFQVDHDHFRVDVDQCSVVTPRPWLFQVHLPLLHLRTRFSILPKILSHTALVSTHNCTHWFFTLWIQFRQLTAGPDLKVTIFHQDMFTIDSGGGGGGGGDELRGWEPLDVSHQWSSMKWTRDSWAS